MRVEAKICGLTRAEDARAAAAAGADYLGVVFAASPRRQGPEEAAAIWSGLECRRAGVFANENVELVVELAEKLGLDVIQLHGDESVDDCRRLRSAGQWKIWKAIKPPRFEAGLALFADSADGLLLEGAGGAVRGGVGAKFDWAGAQALRRDWPPGLELIVAGGLTPGNVGEAIRTLHPNVVDVSSGVEAALGRKDAETVRAFVRAVRESGDGPEG